MSENIQNGEPERIDSQQLDRTLITPHLEERISPGSNLIYCSTFQVAWNELQDNLIKEKIRLAGAPRMAEVLNKQLSTKDDMSKDCYAAAAGKLRPEFVEHLHKELKDKFGEEAPPKLEASIPQPLMPLIAYAYLYKNLEFSTEFESLPEPVNFRSGGEVTGVESFGFGGGVSGGQGAKLREQVLVIAGATSPLDFFHSQNQDDDDPAARLLRQVFPERNSTDSAHSRKGKEIIIQLRFKSENEEMIVALIEPKDSLIDTMESVMKRAHNPSSSRMRAPDALRIPKLDFNVEHSFEELTGRAFENEGWEDWFIATALQWIRFRLNERGALLRSEARIEAWSGLPLRYTFDEPFLICLRHKDAKYPYFAMWVDNDELMLKTE